MPILTKVALLGILVFSTVENPIYAKIMTIFMGYIWQNSWILYSWKMCELMLSVFCIVWYTKFYICRANENRQISQ